ncbi:conserved protein of unknown function [Modestobacter italicus]|uniref:DUF1579 domain-containing protein n=1 Tax=Modestobacter italicus (strain DSM 44449 / CECT 9708 / BC 501) TaxID=2732864 RepID=I4F0T3_MODI5|nr:hypothetical protein [Modestobacter marinus]CCH89246.1 conserved protein of unknown function [Modestobacter marinus]
MSAADADAAAARREAIHSLDRLVGTWVLDGTGSSGSISYDWYEGDAFLVQTIDMVSSGETTRGVEYIGWNPETATLRSHFFASSGEILEYTYDLTGETLTIWFGGTDSAAKYVGTFEAAGDRVIGAWQWPGGGYESNMTRIEREAKQ